MAGRAQLAQRGDGEQLGWQNGRSHISTLRPERPIRLAAEPHRARAFAMRREIPATVPSHAYTV